MHPQPLLTLIPQQKLSKLTKYTLFLAKNHDEIKNKSNQNQTFDAYDVDGLVANNLTPNRDDGYNVANVDLDDRLLRVESSS